MNVPSTLRAEILRRHLGRSIAEWCDAKMRLLFGRISPGLLARYVYLIKRGRLPNLNNPKTFDEKLMWLMLHWHHPLKSQCSDKWNVRNYVKQHGFAANLTHIYGVYRHPDEIGYDSLPSRFVLKATHGSGFNVLCANKDALHWTATKRQLEAWLKSDISRIAGEVHYADIEPRLICEEYLVDENGQIPSDYKLFCFNGIVHCTMVCTDRHLENGPYFTFYDAGWTRRLSYSRSDNRANGTISAPKSYSDMLRIAQTLSRPFPFVRVDMYDINGSAVFGEMTFTPNGCIDRDYTESAQSQLGDLVVLPLRPNVADAQLKRCSQRAQ